MTKSVIIVGAGAGGITSAARLAKAGFKVTVLEKNAFTGGRCSLIHHDGYRFDQGPSLLLLPNMFHQTFADLGTSLSAEGVELYKCDPNYNIWFDDGERVQLSTDLAVMKRELERFEGKGGFERYLQYLGEAHQHYELSVKHVLVKAWDTYASLLRPSFLKWVLNLHPLESMYSRASHYFKTERLRRLFTFESMYMGMSPFDAPGTYSLLQYTELVEGIWYPKGGFFAVLYALVRVGKRLGVEYRLNTSVKHIEGNTVTLESGETLNADVILINADLTYAYNHLLKPSSYARRLSTRATSCSSVSFYWALDKKIPQLTTHNIFLAEDYKGSFDSIFKRHSLPDEPSFYVNVPSRVDPTAAPEGKDSLVVLVPCGHIQQNIQDYDKLVSDAREAVIRVVNQRLSANGEKVDLSKHIIHESSNNPITWRSLFNLDRGAILGISHDFFNVLSFRPRTKCEIPGYKNVYFVGASTQPGTGVPIVLGGSKVVCDRICKDVLGSASVGNTQLLINDHGRMDGNSRLDVNRGLIRLSWVNLIIFLLVAVLLSFVFAR